MAIIHSIREIEQHSLAAWHALETHNYDGWLLRVSGGYTGRANSINPLNHSTLPLAEKLAHCHDFYSARNLPTIFRLHDAISPPNLDAALDTLGYERYNETLVQTCTLDSYTKALDANFQLTTQPTDDWLKAFASMNNLNPTHVPIAKQMLQQNPLTCCFAWVDDAAVGLGVFSGGYVALFDIVVHSQARGQGLGRTLVTNIMRWGQQKGAHTAYLQVVGTNAVALHLYNSLGYQEHHRYWYRRLR